LDTGNDTKYMRLLGRQRRKLEVRGRNQTWNYHLSSWGFFPVLGGEINHEHCQSGPGTIETPALTHNKEVY